MLLSFEEVIMNLSLLAQNHAMSLMSEQSFLAPSILLTPNYIPQHWSLTLSGIAELPNFYAFIYLQRAKN